MSVSRERLVNFFSKYNPEKIDGADKICEAYFGKEPELFAALTAKYGPEPTGDDSQYSTPDALMSMTNIKERIRRMCKTYRPERSSESELEQLFEKYAGAEKSLLDALVSKYGPEPAFPHEGGIVDEAEPMAAELGA